MIHYKKCFDDALALTDASNNDLPVLHGMYESAIESQSIDNSLIIKVKNTLENIRSSLDMLAQGLVQKYNPSVNKKKRIYFPYAKLETTVIPPKNK